MLAVAPGERVFVDTNLDAVVDVFANLGLFAEGIGADVTDLAVQHAVDAVVECVELDGGGEVIADIGDVGGLQLGFYDEGAVGG